ncbi:MAG TPA: PEP-CTERM sorting domain-containing protein [Gemmatimonadaceae bacterium]|nr:PEP-CTERM sorting domain-containing protein [Gemmatimonadaceae bacterium]
MRSCRWRDVPTILSIAAGALASGPATAAAQAINWTDWLSATPIVGNTATVTGSILVEGTPVGISYSGEVAFTQTTGGTNFWMPRSTFLGASLTDAAPISSDIIALNGGLGITSTFTFATPVLNPFISIVSAGRPGLPVDYIFSAEPTIVAGGASASFGGGPLVPLPGDPNGVRGLEGNGTVRFNGSFTSLSFTTVGGEFWSGITIGIEGLAEEPPPSVVPEPSTVLLTATGLLGTLAAARRRRRSG